MAGSCVEKIHALWTEWPKCRLAFIFVMYMGTGAIFYRHVERKECTPGVAGTLLDDSETCTWDEDADPPGYTEPWSIVDSLYFSMVSMSTVGYGDLTPSSGISRAFTVFYIMFGITVVFSQLSSGLCAVITAGESALLGFLDRFWGAKAEVSGRASGLDGKAIDLSGNGKADFVAPPGPIVYWSQASAMWVIILVAMQVVSAAVFASLEPDMTFEDAWYHCLITATTVGYGDVPITTQRARLFAFFHIAISVAWLAAFIGKVFELHDKRTVLLKRVELLTMQIDKDILMSLDQDHKGVTKLEFVVGMFIKLGVQLCGEPLEWKDVEPFLARFEAADKDGSGRLTKEDLQLMSEVHANISPKAKAKAQAQKGAASGKVTPVSTEHEVQLKYEPSKMDESGSPQAPEVS